MLRAYQLSMVRPVHDHHSHGPWSLKDRTETDFGSVGHRGQKVSTHILGVGIVLVGILILAIGLIMGLEFPDYVHEQNKNKQCVVHPDHELYEAWEQGTQWTRQVRAYYWTLSNADSFLKGQTPMFIEQGPYVYTETDMKDDVTFSVTEVTYRRIQHYVFDTETTQRECGTCRESDKLTILSPWYLQKVGQVGGETNLGLYYIHTYIEHYLQTHNFIYFNEDDERVFNDSLAVLGTYNAAQIFADQPLAKLSFGAWLHNATGSYKSTLEAERSDKPLSLPESKSFYKVLTNVTLLGGRILQAYTSDLEDKCEKWAQGLCSLHTRLKSNVSVSDCGVFYVFHKCHDSISTRVRDVLQQTFCPSTTDDACLNITSMSDDLLLAYQEAIYEFLLYLSELVLDDYLTSNDLSIVISRNQSQLALGFDVSGDDIFPGHHITGLLHSQWIGETRGENPLWKMYTCLENRDMNNNMKLKEFNHSWSSPEGLLRNVATASLVSFTDFVTSCSKLRTCQSCDAPGASLSFFMDQLLRPADFVLNGSTSLYGIDVFRYELDEDTFTNSTHYRVTDGLQEMAGVTGYFSWASLPQVIGGDMSHVTTQKSSAPSTSYVLVEPVTGRVWERSVKLQWNVGINTESAHALDRHISVTELPLPVFWSERMATITSSEVSGYKHLISRLMSVSCGGIIGFSVIAIIVVIIGVVVCLYPSKPNRVTPMLEDATHSLPNGRHV